MTAADEKNEESRKSSGWDRDKFGPGWAYIVTAFHVIVLLAAAAFFYISYLECVCENVTEALPAASNPEASAPLCCPAIKSALACKLGLAVLFGATGGALIASRAVVYNVKSGNYQPIFLLWQITTPIHSAILAGVGFFIVRAGLVTLSTSPSVREPQDTYFVIGFSFLVGIASESFLHRLLKTARTLFGEGKEEKKEEEDQSGAPKTESEHGPESEVETQK